MAGRKKAMSEAEIAGIEMHNLLAGLIWPRQEDLFSGKSFLTAKEAAKAEGAAREFLRRGASPDFDFPLFKGFHISGLAAFIFMGAFGAAEALLEAGANPNRVEGGKAEASLPPLYFALRQGWRKRAGVEEAARRLMAAGADPFHPSCSQTRFDLEPRRSDEPLIMMMIFFGLDDLAADAMRSMPDKSLRALTDSLPTVLAWCHARPKLLARIKGLGSQALGEAIDELTDWGDNSDKARASYDPTARWSQVESDILLGSSQDAAPARPGSKRRL